MNFETSNIILKVSKRKLKSSGKKKKLGLEKSHSCFERN
jgi:hypothetical protein